jgi:hypothetical protein
MFDRQAVSFSRAAGLRRVRQLLLVAGLAAASLAQAQVVMGDAQQDRVDNRQDRQAARIGQGVASGELTRHETAALMRQQHHIHRLERRTEADGVVTGREARRMESAQDRASARIYHHKHDRQARPHAH